MRTYEERQGKGGEVQTSLRRWTTGQRVGLEFRQTKEGDIWGGGEGGGDGCC